MSEILIKFYKKTWWMWLLCVAICIALAYFVPTVSVIFIILIPGILGYSVYFGMVRGPEMFDNE